MNKSRTSQGFVLVFSMLIIALMILMVTLFSSKSLVYTYFDKTVLERAQAQQVALNGIQVAFALLTPPLAKKAPSTSNSQPQRIDMQQHSISTVMPLMHTWQVFNLKKETEGLDATLKLCITCEEGKLSLNAFFDLPKKTYMQSQNSIDPKKIWGAALMLFKSKDAKENLVQNFDLFLKQHIYPFNDATELTGLSGLPALYKNNLFYIPAEAVDKKASQNVFLMDLLSVYNQGLKINPWLMSPSVMKLYGLQSNPEEQSYKAGRAQLAKTLYTAKDKSALKERWNAGAAKLYGKDFDALPKDLVALFDESIRAKHFSVVSYGIVGAITQRLVAIIAQNGAQEFVIKKLYWL